LGGAYGGTEIKSIKIEPENNRAIIFCDPLQIKKEEKAGFPNVKLASTITGFDLILKSHEEPM
jgi:hypothetical protein